MTRNGELIFTVISLDAISRARRPWVADELNGFALRQGPADARPCKGSPRGSPLLALGWLSSGGLAWTIGGEVLARRPVPSLPGVASERVRP